MIYRNLATNRIEPLPWRVRLADGTTRTDPEQWATDPEALAAAGFEQTTRTPADDAYDLEQAKGEKIAQIDQAWSDKVTAGWMVPGEAYALGIDVSDVTLLLGAYTLARDANALGLPDAVSVIDTQGQAHQYHAHTITPLMLQYGQARAAMSAADAALRQAVAAATTMAELDAVVVP